MSRKGKGINAERELIHLFWAKEWAAVRIAGSGSNKYPSADIVAGNPLRKLVIECKSTGSDHYYFSEAEVEQLAIFSRIFGA